MAMAIHITHIMDGVILATDGEDTQVTATQVMVMAITILTQHLMPIIIAEEVLHMEEITTELRLMQETAVPIMQETMFPTETAFTAGTV